MWPSEPKPEFSIYDDNVLDDIDLSDNFEALPPELREGVRKDNITNFCGRICSQVKNILLGQYSGDLKLFSKWVSKNDFNSYSKKDIYSCSETFNVNNVQNNHLSRK
jgi:hypothetical protein